MLVEFRQKPEGYSKFIDQGSVEARSLSEAFEKKFAELGFSKDGKPSKRYEITRIEAQWARAQTPHSEWRAAIVKVPEPAI